MKRGFLQSRAGSEETSGSIISTRKLSLDDFEIVRLLGEGNFSKVYSAVIKATGEKVALKVILLERVQRLHKAKEVLMEKHCLIKLNPLAYRDATRKSFDLGQSDALDEIATDSQHHGAEHVLKLYHTFKTDFELCFVTELCDGQELWDQIKGIGVLDLTSLQWLMSQILISVQFLHTNRIVHRDIKAENIVLKLPGNIVRFVDFGTALDLDLPYDSTLAGNASQPLHRKSSGNEFRFFVGTPHFMAPEAQSNISIDDCSSDIWSLGCLVYQIYFGSPPFSAASDFLQFARSTKLDLDIPCFVPPQVESFIRACLVSDSKQRPTAEDLWKSDLMSACGGECRCHHPSPLFYPLLSLFVSLRTVYAQVMLTAVLETAPFLSPPKGDADGTEQETLNTEETSLMEETPTSDVDWLKTLFPKCEGRFLLSGSACEKAAVWFEAIVLSPGRKAWVEIWSRLAKRASIEKLSSTAVEALAVAENTKAVIDALQISPAETAQIVMAYLHVAFDTMKSLSTGPRRDEYYSQLAEKWLEARGDKLKPKEESDEATSD